MKALPAGVVAYKRTPEFNESSVPAGLLRSHNTKQGVWAQIVVLEGSLIYRILQPDIKEYRLAPGTRGVIEPMILHEVEPQAGGVHFYVEFYREAAPTKEEIA